MASIEAVTLVAIEKTFEKTSPEEPYWTVALPEKARVPVPSAPPLPRMIMPAFAVLPKTKELLMRRSRVPAPLLLRLSPVSVPLVRATVPLLLVTATLPALMPLVER